MQKLLAFDTSTERLSIAVRHGDQLCEYNGAGGALASAELIPRAMHMLAELGLALPALDAIVFGRGPGSFTGLRTACSVAQGLGFGAGVPLLPADTLLAVAEEARAHSGAQRIVALLDARMDEVYCAAYDLGRPGPHGVPEALMGPQLMAPEAVRLEPGWLLAGNALQSYGPRLPQGAQRLLAWPTATALLRLAPALLAAGLAVPPQQAWPLYIRDKVAQTTAERAQALRERVVS